MAMTALPSSERDSRAARVVLFIDAQNLYGTARRAFGGPAAPAHFGQVDPMKLGYLLCSRRPLGCEGTRRALQEVRIYRGRPDPRKQPRTYAPHMRQCDAWAAAGATVITRPLRYPERWSQERCEEKGIDVAIALDMVMMAMRDELDVAILASADTDLRPALEAYPKIPRDPEPTVEVTAWKATGSSQLRVKDHHVWCHFIDRDDFQRIRDRRDYNVGR